MNLIIKLFVLICCFTINKIVFCEQVQLKSKIISCQYIYHYQTQIDGQAKVNLICIDTYTKFQKIYEIDQSGNVRFVFQLEDSKTNYLTLAIRVLSQNRQSREQLKNIYYLTRELKHNQEGWKIDYVSGELGYQASLEKQADIKNMLQEFYMTKVQNLSNDNLCNPNQFKDCQVLNFYLQNEFIFYTVKAGSKTDSTFSNFLGKLSIQKQDDPAQLQLINKDPKMLEYAFCPNFIMLQSTLSSSKQYFLVSGNFIENKSGQKFVKCIQLNSNEDTFVLNVVGQTFYLAKFDSVSKTVNTNVLGDYNSVSKIPEYNSALIVQGAKTFLYCNGSQKPLIQIQNTNKDFLGEDLEDLQQFYQGYFLANFKDHKREIYQFQMDESTCMVTKFIQMNLMPRYTKPIFKDYDIFTPYLIYIINRMCADEQYFKTTLIDNEYINGCSYSITRQTKQSDIFCNLQCRTCMPEDPTKCTSCFVEYNSYLDPSTQTCKCPIGFYIEQGAPLKCSPCISGCDECINYTSCKTCSSSRVLKNGVCDCNSSQYFNILQNDCINLPINCDQANVLGQCTQCKSSFFLQNGICATGCDGFVYKNQSCEKTCPKGTFQNADQKICQDCNSLCTECTTLDTCTVCRDDAKLEGDKCVPKCSSGSYPDRQETISCLPCHQNCKTCIGPLESNCTGCKEGYYQFKKG
ncbi:zinc finger, C2H2 type family protein (macronuclear) [Tetrahymena thermophila SB210]|uniref:Zinc finger, C2H2 type family protein n=1 Tax=Tetrahymena thermophila (strain SB210) TaxID=312017 RepID=Q22YQ5_TETTS|nr:zinc finger, C2H2 type family protein [Tetrahymena thermophila SB210]EAR90616.2 zinc finger, C2H2 type family protein [Tetrahymena thermophila SB210]|eukprot:XP_001010861.2 zinc finger, C2H2 type family protein [Tetrahymena thermophila SB210]